MSIDPMRRLRHVVDSWSIVPPLTPVDRLRPEDHPGEDLTCAWCGVGVVIGRQSSNRWWHPNCLRLSHNVSRAFRDIASSSLMMSLDMFTDD